jgi:hypothetical protein
MMDGYGYEVSCRRTFIGFAEMAVASGPVEQIDR